MNTLTIVGYGDIARRALPVLATHFTAIRALIRPCHPHEPGQHLPAAPVTGDLDDPATLTACDLRASHIAYLAPPPAHGTTDPRMRGFLGMLAAMSPLPERLVYISTSGAYGDCGGAWIDESHPVSPLSDRARRRVDAETAITRFGAERRVRTIILRVPGIYAADRLPLERLRKRTPVLRAQDDVYTNHIHADDLAAIVTAVLTHPGADGIYHASDDSAIAMGDWFDLVADRSGLPRPPRIARADAETHIPAPLLSFMRESRRLRNDRMKAQLGIVLKHPTVFDGVPNAIGI